MPYAIQTVDKPDSAALRAKVRDAHLKYLDANLHLLLAAGAVTSDDGTGGHGGILIVDTDVRKEAEDFIAGTLAGRGSSSHGQKRRATLYATRARRVERAEG